MSEETTETMELEPSGKHHGAIEVQTRAYEPSPLALLSETDFERRVQMAQIEIARMREIQMSVMQEDVDYGLIPGTKKRSLFQPGAQILNKLAGFRPDYAPTRILGDGKTAPEITYEVRCTLLNGDDVPVAEGWGSANSWEKKHRYRYAEKVCPECGVAAIIRSQYDDAKYYCFPNKGGCKAKFQEGQESERIDAQPAMTENQDPHDLENTVLKMGCKRSYIAVTVNAHACSGQFAQDTDDLPPQAETDAAEAHAGGTTTTKKREKPKPARSQDDSLLSEGRIKLCWGKLTGRLTELKHDVNTESKQAMHDMVLGQFDVEHFKDLKTSQLDAVLEAIAAFE